MTSSTNRFGALILGTALAAGLLLALADAKPAEAAFPGTNGKIAFLSDRDGVQWEIYMMNPDGTSQTRLTNNTVDEGTPTLSPDGTKIAFERSLDIHVMNAAPEGPTNQPQRLTNNSALNFGPAFSPNGTRIAFTSTRDGNFEIYVMNADGTNQTRLTNNAVGDFAPAFSPDGQKIAFASSRDGDFEIYAMNSNGTGTPTRLTNNSDRDVSPDFSPDGSKIVFEREKAFTGSRKIHVMDAVDGDGDGNGDNQIRLTRKGVFYDPVFSPDGQKIAFAKAGRRGGIYTMNADGTGKTRLTNTNFDQDHEPSWGPAPPAPPA